MANTSPPNNSSFQRGLLWGVGIVLAVIAILVLVWALGMGGMMRGMMH